jgi:hypothetical protein
MTAREQVASRGVRDLCEGKALEEKKPRNGYGMKQGREVRACQETAERLGKPESGTEAEVTARLITGLARGMSLKGRRSSGESVQAAAWTVKR